MIGKYMVWLLGLVFASLLVCAHLADLQGDAYHRPLSMFRDYEPAWIGYALFGVLLAVGLETARTAFRVRADAHTAFYLVVTGLLTAVAATPSYDLLHTACAFLALATMFVYYAVLLYRSDCIFWLIMHLLIPSVLMMASRLESYGVWQKGMILYFLAAVVIHQSLLAKWLPEVGRRNSSRVRIYIGRNAAVRRSADS